MAPDPDERSGRSRGTARRGAPGAGALPLTEGPVGAGDAHRPVPPAAPEPGGGRDGRSSSADRRPAAGATGRRAGSARRHGSAAVVDRRAPRARTGSTARPARPASGPARAASRPAPGPSRRAARPWPPARPPSPRAAAPATGSTTGATGSVTSATGAAPGSRGLDDPCRSGRATTAPTMARDRRWTRPGTSGAEPVAGGIAARRPAGPGHRRSGASTLPSSRAGVRGRRDGEQRQAREPGQRQAARGRSHRVPSTRFHRQAGSADVQCARSSRCPARSVRRTMSRCAPEHSCDAGRPAGWRGVPERGGPRSTSGGRVVRAPWWSCPRRAWSTASPARCRRARRPAPPAAGRRRAAGKPFSTTSAIRVCRSAASRRPRPASDPPSVTRWASSASSSATIAATSASAVLPCGDRHLPPASSRPAAACAARPRPGRGRSPRRRGRACPRP